MPRAPHAISPDVNPRYAVLPVAVRREDALGRMRRPRCNAVLVLALLGSAPGVAAEPGPLPRPLARSLAVPAPLAVLAVPDPRAEAALFAMPAIAEATRRALGLLQAGDAQGAGRLLDALVLRHPDLGMLRANRAALAMLAGDTAGARAMLEAAAARGFDGIASLVADPLFAGLARDPALRALLAAAPAPAPPPAPVPARVLDRQARVAASNTAWNPATERLEPRFAFPADTSARVAAPRKSAAYELLAEHYRRGRAAGNHGDLYDNRDRGHSALDPDAHPQLTHVAYAPAARAADADYGLNDRILFDRVTLGNASTAITGGALWRSLARLALTRPDGTGPMRLWQNVQANHLYIHPAHKDYGDPGGESGGESGGPGRDLFPANTPYLIVSRGSSGSDRPFLEAAALILAAFRPETKARMIAERLIAPTVQMVFRRSLQTVRAREDYFSGIAHPAAFDAAHINLARMVSLANAIAPGEIPPQVRIRVTEEDIATEGVDFFGQGLSEPLFDTPGAIARIWRARSYSRTMVVSAEDTTDPNGRALSFHWRLLQGDPGRVRITPLDGGTRARITLDWHEPFAISPGNPILSARIDIGVFAHNGAHDSAPAILSVYCPPDAARSYAPGPDGAMRIARIDYGARPDAYADPMLIARAGWRDDYAYDAAGAPAGWTRTRAGAAPGAASDDYTPDGARILTPATGGRPARTEPVAYPLRRTPQGTLALEEISAAAGP